MQISTMVSPILFSLHMAASVEWVVRRCSGSATGDAASRFVSTLETRRRATFERKFPIFFFFLIFNSICSFDLRLDEIFMLPARIFYWDALVGVAV